MTLEGKYLSFETYPPAFTDYENMIENENYDNELLVFIVPEEWGAKWIKENCDCSVAEFYDTYDWDITMDMLECATVTGVFTVSWIETPDCRTIKNNA